MSVDVPSADVVVWVNVSLLLLESTTNFPVIVEPSSLVIGAKVIEPSSPFVPPLYVESPIVNS